MRIEVALWMDRDDARRAHDLLGRSGLCDPLDPASRALAALRDALWAAYACDYPKCVVCDAEMAGVSERRRTCSDRCRQILSRSKRDSGS